MGRGRVSSPEAAPRCQGTACTGGGAVPPAAGCRDGVGLGFLCRAPPLPRPSPSSQFSWGGSWLSWLLPRGPFRSDTSTHRAQSFRLSQLPGQLQALRGQEVPGRQERPTLLSLLCWHPAGPPACRQLGCPRLQGQEQPPHPHLPAPQLSVLRPGQGPFSGLQGVTLGHTVQSHRTEPKAFSFSSCHGNPSLYLPSPTWPAGAS